MQFVACSSRKMEEQLKSLNLQDEIECQRQSGQREHKMISVEIDRPIACSQPVCSQTIRQSVTVRSEQIEPTVYTFRSYDERKSHSERGEKENWNSVKRNDKSIYNYFTNSAQKENNQLKDIRLSHYFDLDELSDNEAQPNTMSSSSYNTYPLKSMRHQFEPGRSTCDFCMHSRSQIKIQEEDDNLICGSCENEPICISCRKEICVQCKRPTHNDDHVSKPSPRPIKQRNFGRELQFLEKPEQTQPRSVRTDNIQQYQFDDESLSSSPEHKPYSFNIAESSIFHPSKSRVKRRLSVSIRNGEVAVQPDSFDELKRITQEKLQKLSKNYGQIRPKKSDESYEHESSTSDEAISVPSQIPKESLDCRPILRENTKKLIEFAKELDRGDHNIFKRIESKHQVRPF